MNNVQERERKKDIKKKKTYEARRFIWEKKEIGERK
jgi:hypothetical protein